MQGRFTLLLFVGLLLIVSTIALANTVPPATTTPAPPAATATPQLQTPPAPPAATPLSADEMQKLRFSADSLAQDSAVQQMAVGAEINGTIVLSVLAALVIFAVLLAVLR